MSSCGTVVNGSNRPVASELTVLYVILTQLYCRISMPIGVNSQLKEYTGRKTD